MIESNAPPPAVASEDARAFLRLDAGQDDSVLDLLIGAATLACERCIGRPLVQREVLEVVAADTAWHVLTTQPVRFVVMIEGIGAEGYLFSLPQSSYTVDLLDENGARFRLIDPGGSASVRVRYFAGMAGDAFAVPAALRLGMLQLMAYWHRERDRKEAGEHVPVAVRALWQDWRRMQIA
jgi:uncharacterized phiE125 gp8 family phage protein